MQRQQMWQGVRGNGRWLVATTVAVALAAGLAACGGGGSAAGVEPAANLPGGGANGSPAAAVPGLPPADGPLALSVDCSGAHCAATPDGRWSGSGVGIWRLTNPGPQEATVDLAVTGLVPGQRVLMLFSNGSDAAGATLPAAGIAAEPALAPAAPVAGVSPVAVRAPAAAVVQGTERAAHVRAHDHAHAQALATSRRIDRETPLVPKPPGAAILPEVSLAPAPTPWLGRSRTWFDTFGVRTPYMTTARAMCPVGGNRRAVFWVDPNAEAAGHVTPADLQVMQAAMCGPAGGLTRLTAWLGDVWGPHGWSNLIEDVPLQDLHIAFIDAPESSGWAGYFSSVNKYRTSARADSNEALVIFVRASQVRVDLSFLTSTLIHEATHMVNNYQRMVRRGVLHEAWLEETSAMMSEDVVTPRVLAQPDGRPYNKIVDVRLPGYLAAGGAVSFVEWQRLGVPHYDLGGAFGAWLNRRYGLALARALVTDCGTSAPGSSYACVDALIRRFGGPGFDTEFARLGATVFAALPALGAPEGYRFAARREDDYELAAVDLAAQAWRRPLEPPALTAGWGATTHIWREDTVASGQTAWRRQGVRLPARTTLVVVAQ